MIKGYATVDAIQESVACNDHISYVPLGSTGLMVSQAGFGGYRISSGVVHHEKALKYFKDYHELYDTLYNESISEQLALANAKYETEKKENQITLQELEIAKQKNTRNRLIIGGVIALLFATGIFQWIFYKQRRKKKEAGFFNFKFTVSFLSKKWQKIFPS